MKSTKRNSIMSRPQQRKISPSPSSKTKGFTPKKTDENLNIERPLKESQTKKESNEKTMTSQLSVSIPEQQEENHSILNSSITKSLHNGEESHERINENTQNNYSSQLSFHQMSQDSIYSQQGEYECSCGRKMQGVYKLSCGHKIGPQALRDHIKNQLKQGNCDFYCPKFQGSERCTKVLTENQINLIANYNTTQRRQIEEKKTEIWMKKNTKKCPDCSSSVCILGLRTRRVKCPKCKTKCYCFDCQEPWPEDTEKCFNNYCVAMREFVQNCQKDRQFKLKDKTTGKLITVKTPSYRACPRKCGNIINNHKGCKHTRCPCMQMKFSFCFVCLALNEKPNLMNLTTWVSGKWPCGASDEYCGKVAQNQTL